MRTGVETPGSPRFISAPLDSVQEWALLVAECREAWSRGSWQGEQGSSAHWGPLEIQAGLGGLAAGGAIDHALHRMIPLRTVRKRSGHVLWGARKYFNVGRLLTSSVGPPWTLSRLRDTIRPGLLGLSVAPQPPRWIPRRGLWQGGLGGSCFTKQSRVGNRLTENEALLGRDQEMSPRRVGQQELVLHGDQQMMASLVILQGFVRKYVGLCRKKDVCRGAEVTGSVRDCPVHCILRGRP